MASFADMILAGGNPSISEFLTKQAMGQRTPGINPASPMPAAATQEPEKPQPSPLQKFLGNPMLLNVLAQQGHSLTPGPSPLGVVGRAGLATNQQNMAQDRAQLENDRLRAQTELARQKAKVGSGGQRIVQSAQTLNNGNIGFLNAFTGEVVDTGQKAGGKGQVIDMPGVGQVVYDPVENTLTQVNPEDVIQTARGGRSEAEAAGTQRANIQAIPERSEVERRVAAQAELPTKRIAFDKAKSELERLRNHPGKSAAQGVKGPTAGFGITGPIPGTAAADFVALRDQAAGGAFLEAYQQLKGGGPITDREGAAALAAITRMGNPDISEAEFDRALDDYMEAIEAGFAKLEQSAGVEATSGTPDFSTMTNEELQRYIEENQ